MARDPSRGVHPVLIGGEGWAFELTQPEWEALSDLVLTLVRQHRALVDQLMAEEEIELELDRGLWWGCLQGNRGSWSLSGVVARGAGRGGEGHWPAPAGAATVAAMRTLWDNRNDQCN